MQDRKTNIPQLYVTNFLTGLVFWYGIEKVFMSSIGINATGIAVNAIVFLAIQLLLDVPSGVLADRWSRKYTLFLGIVFLAVSSLILGASHDLGMYLMGTVIYGLYVVMTSGTFQALTYDSLKAQGRESSYSRIQGATYAAFLTGVCLSSFASGFIGQNISLKGAYFLTLIPCALNLITILTIYEPKFHKPATDRNYFAHMAEAFRATTRTRALVALSLVSVAATVIKGTQTEYAQLYYLALNLSTVLIGIAFGVMALTAAVASIQAHKFSDKLINLYPIVVVLVGAFAWWRSAWLLLAFLAVAWLTNAIQNLTVSQIQHEVGSHIRATTISALSFAANLTLVPIGLLFGYLTDHATVFTAYQMVFIIGAVSVLGLVILQSTNRFTRLRIQ